MRDTLQPRAIAAALFALALLAGCTRPAAPASPAAPAATVPAASSPTTSSDVTSQSVPPYSAVTTDPTAPAPALDAFIAEQYPGYRVQRRIALPNQIDPGRLSVACLLQNTRDQRFRLLVNVASLAPTETAADAETSHYGDLVGRVLTNDDVFSAEAVRAHPALAGGGQDAIVSAFAQRVTMPGAIAHDASFDDETGVTMGVEAGSEALSKALENFGGENDFEVELGIPRGGSVAATVTPLPPYPY